MGNRPLILLALLTVATAILLGGRRSSAAAASEPTSNSAPPPAAAPTPPASHPSEALSDESVAAFSFGIVGTKHDFTQGGKIARDMCLPCHMPHISAAQVPLLERAAPTTQPLRPYQTIYGALDSSSLLCLSCHDGVVAPDVYAGPHAATWQETAAGARTAGRRSISHPIGVLYPNIARQYQPASAVTADGLIELPGGRVQCVSCHDPHNTRRHEKMLVKSNERSRLCLACHRL
ncbi:Doubled CXXCH motif [Phycisphaerae bacterium RAS1]|nr:Doubled CXXCH motif [Phycisphaerae bacterium RAS1]